MAQEFLSTCDYAKEYDFLTLSKEEFLSSYRYITEESYNLSYEYAMDEYFIEDLCYGISSLSKEEQECAFEDISYMQEEGTSYISSNEWKEAVKSFVAKNYNNEQKAKLREICTTVEF